MKKVACLVMMVAIVSAVWFNFRPEESEWESDFGKPWRVDLEASLEQIEAVPDQFAERFPSLEAYRDRVRKLIRGLSLTIHDDGTATMRQSGSDLRLVWQKHNDFDYWLQTNHSLFSVAPTMGHGFERVSADSARLKFQLEWSENKATKEFLVLRG